jgi:hypothetical protein
MIQELTRWQNEAVETIASMPMLINTLNRIDPTVKAIGAIITVFLAGIGTAWTFGPKALFEVVGNHQTVLEQIKTEHSILIDQATVTEARFNRILCVLDAQVEAMELDIPVRQALEPCLPARPGLLDVTR